MKEYICKETEGYGLTYEQAIIVRNLTLDYIKDHKGVFSKNENVRKVSRCKYNKYFEECIEFAKEYCPANQN